MDNLASKYGNPDPYTIEEDKNKRSKNIMMGVACVSVTGVLGFLIWKYGLGELFVSLFWCCVVNCVWHFYAYLLCTN